MPHVLLVALLAHAHTCTLCESVHRPGDGEILVKVKSVKVQVAPIFTRKMEPCRRSVVSIFFSIIPIYPQYSIVVSI